MLVYLVALVLVLSLLGFDITAILAGLGIGGLAVGLAAQHAIADILSGLIIFFERPISAVLMTLAVLMLLSPLARWALSRKFWEIVGPVRTEK